MLIITNLSFSFTLNPNTGRGFSDNEINVYIASNDCSNANFSANEYKNLIEDAIKTYWNDIPSSNLKLNIKGVDTSIDLSSDTHTTALTKVPENSILAGCNDLAANGFDDGSILGSAVMNCSGSSCRSILLLNDHANTYLAQYSNADKEAVIAHEIGHAIGLGHSEYNFNLMYYSISGKYQKYLGLDDIHGVSYLYPKESKADLLGISLLGGCGIMSVDNQNKSLKPFIFSFILGVFLALLLIIGFKIKQQIK